MQVSICDNLGANFNLAGDNYSRGAKRIPQGVSIDDILLGAVWFPAR